jgi:hypothetical protein
MTFMPLRFQGGGAFAEFHGEEWDRPTGRVGKFSWSTPAIGPAAVVRNTNSLVAAL